MGIGGRRNKAEESSMEVDRVGKMERRKELEGGGTVN
jgi:hypothetical protein